MVFFPSYAFMDQVLQQYRDMYTPDEETALEVQSPR
jgi:Rad3-related DNA helicase